MPSPPGVDLLGSLARHRVAANLLMVMLVMAGLWALLQLNRQFFPDFAFERITVSVAWSGASPEDVEQAITAPLEQELRTLAFLRNITSTSTTASANLTLEYEDGTDMGMALERVKQRVEGLRSLPESAERPLIQQAIRYEPVARIVLSGDLNPRELRLLARRFERELLARGIARVILNGLPEEQIAIQIEPARLRELGLSLPAVAGRLDTLSQDLPAGVVGRDNVARQLRGLDQRRDESGFAELALLSETGQHIRLGDIASIERRPLAEQVSLSLAKQPAIELEIQRASTADSLASAEILQEWVAATRPGLPPGVELTSYAGTWKLLRDRLLLLLKNGAGGLVLVVLILFVFLNARVAFWVAAGIPVSFMAALAVLYLFGGSINMISLFALIMVLGIIVDDAIVVGEDAATHHQRGEPPLEAAEGGARRMFGPVMASSLTTIAAFMPLMLVGGSVGNILFDIPLVAVCTIIASLIECFLVLPGHLRMTFERARGERPNRLRQRMEATFAYFRDAQFRPLVSLAVAHRWSTLASALAMLIICTGLILGGRINFSFFPQPEGTIIYASASFVASTPTPQVEAFLNHLEDTLIATDQHFGGGLVSAAVTRHGRSQAAAMGGGQQGEQHGSMRVELIEPDNREVHIPEFIAAWRARVEHPAGLEQLSLFPQAAGPPGRDLAVRLTGTDAIQLKAAAEELAALLAAFSGVSAVEDDMPRGRAQLVYHLTPTAEAQGLSVESVGQQLRAAYDGQRVQLFQDGQEEVEVRVMLDDTQRGDLLSLEHLELILADGSAMPLANAVVLTPRQGFESLRRRQGQLAVEISADVDASITNSNNIIERLNTQIPELASRHGVEFSFEGRRADQRETLEDMRRGALYALLLIYLVLAWIFSSYGWPLVVMSAIPFGIVGAILGHWLLGLDITALSLFGIFGLAGIVINDSIILVMFFKELRADGMPVQEALVEAACQRLRAVLLTSLTTIAGLLPLLFETSLQAQFLIPMAVSISAGLTFATFLVLFFIPALLSVHESIAPRREHPGLSVPAGVAVDQ